MTYKIINPLRQFFLSAKSGGVVTIFEEENILLFYQFKLLKNMHIKAKASDSFVAGY